MGSRIDPIVVERSDEFYPARTMTEVEARATEQGCVVVLPGPKDLFIDLDDGAGRLTFNKTWPILVDREIEQAEGRLPVIVRRTPSLTVGHEHVIVRLGRAVEPFERIALEAALGSDPIRAMIATADLRAGYTWYSCFFEKKS